MGLLGAIRKINTITKTVQRAFRSPEKTTVKRYTVYMKYFNPDNGSITEAIGGILAQYEVCRTEMSKARFPETQLDSALQLTQVMTKIRLSTMQILPTNLNSLVENAKVKAEVGLHMKEINDSVILETRLYRQGLKIMRDALKTNKAAADAEVAHQRKLAAIQATDEIRERKQAHRQDLERLANQAAVKRAKQEAAAAAKRAKQEAAATAKKTKEEATTTAKKAKEEAAAAKRDNEEAATAAKRAKEEAASLPPQTPPPPTPPLNDSDELPSPPVEKAGEERVAAAAAGEKAAGEKAADEKAAGEKAAEERVAAAAGNNVSSPQDVNINIRGSTEKNEAGKNVSNIEVLPRRHIPAATRLIQSVPIRHYQTLETIDENSSGSDNVVGSTDEVLNDSDSSGDDDDEQASGEKAAVKVAHVEKAVQDQRIAAEDAAAVAAAAKATAEQKVAEEVNKANKAAVEKAAAEKAAEEKAAAEKAAEEKAAEDVKAAAAAAKATAEQKAAEEVNKAKKAAEEKADEEKAAAEKAAQDAKAAEQQAEDDKATAEKATADAAKAAEEVQKVAAEKATAEQNTAQEEVRRKKALILEKEAEETNKATQEKIESDAILEAEEERLLVAKEVEIARVARVREALREATEKAAAEQEEVRRKKALILEKEAEETNKATQEKIESDAILEAEEERLLVAKEVEIARVARVREALREATEKAAAEQKAAEQKAAVEKAAQDVKDAAAEKAQKAEEDQRIAAEAAAAVAAAAVAQKAEKAEKVKRENEALRLKKEAEEAEKDKKTNEAHAAKIAIRVKEEALHNNNSRRGNGVSGSEVPPPPTGDNTPVDEAEESKRINAEHAAAAATGTTRENLPPVKKPRAGKGAHHQNDTTAKTKEDAEKANEKAGTPPVDADGGGPVADPLPLGGVTNESEAENATRRKKLPPVNPPVNRRGLLGSVVNADEVNSDEDVRRHQQSAALFRDGIDSTAGTASGQSTTHNPRPPAGLSPHRPNGTTIAKTKENAGGTGPDDKHGGGETGPTPAPIPLLPPKPDGQSPHRTQAIGTPTPEFPGDKQGGPNKISKHGGLPADSPKPPKNFSKRGTVVPPPPPRDKNSAALDNTPVTPRETKSVAVKARETGGVSTQSVPHGVRSYTESGTGPKPRREPSGEFRPLAENAQSVQKDTIEPTPNNIKNPEFNATGPSKKKSNVAKAWGEEVPVESSPSTVTPPPVESIPSTANPPSESPADNVDEEIIYGGVVKPHTRRITRDPPPLDNGRKNPAGEKKTAWGTTSRCSVCRLPRMSANMLGFLWFPRRVRVHQRTDPAEGIFVHGAYTLLFEAFMNLLRLCDSEFITNLRDCEVVGEPAVFMVGSWEDMLKRIQGLTRHMVTLIAKTKPLRVGLPPSNPYDIPDGEI
jgi:hypothetical protein